jgi:hypothetical protein
VILVTEGPPDATDSARGTLEELDAFQRFMNGALTKYRRISF